MAGRVPLSDPGERPPAARVARNTVLRLAAEVAARLASLALFVVLAREFGAATLGEFVFAYALVQLLWPVANFGLDRLLLRDAARDRSAVESLFYGTVWVKVLVTLAGTAVTIGVLAAIDYSDRVQLLVLILGIGQATALAGTSAQTVFQAYEQMEYYFYSHVPRALVSSLSGIVVVALGGGIVAVALSGTIVTALGAVLAFAILHRRFARPAFAFRPRGWPALARAAAPMGAQEVISQIIFRIDTVLLSLLTTNAVVGVYAAGYRVFEATLFIAWSVGTSVLPLYSYAELDGTPPLRKVFEGSLKFVLALVVPIGVATFVCAEPIVDLLFGLPAYEDSVPVLRWLSGAVVAYAIGHLAGSLAVVRAPARLVVGAAVLVATFNVAGNLVLIPIYEANAAAAMTLASEVLLAVLYVVVARRVVGAPRWLWTAGAPLVAGAVMAAVMVPLRDTLSAALVVGAVAYLVVLALAEGRALRGDLAAIRAAVARPSDSIIPPGTG